MKVLVTALSAGSELSGVQRHAFNVVRCLLSREEVTAVHLAIGPWQYELARRFGLDRMERLHLEIAEAGHGAIARNLWFYRGLPQLTARLRVDLVHLGYPVWVQAGAMTCPVVVTLHDLYPYDMPSNFGFPKVVFNRFLLERCLHSVDSIACVSQATQQKLYWYFRGDAANRAVRISNCLDAPPPETGCPPHPRIFSAPFLLCVAQHRRNKNIDLLLRAFTRCLEAGTIDAEMQLAIIGIRGPETVSIEHAIAELGLESSVVLMEGIADADLRWCYRHCEALVSPSSVEGFGYPVAEALREGCRVVCSDIAAHREIGDGHCRFVSMRGDPEANFAQAITSSLLSPRPEPVEFPQFSVRVIAAQYLELYHRLIEESARQPAGAGRRETPLVATER